MRRYDNLSDITSVLFERGLQMAANQSHQTLGVISFGLAVGMTWAIAVAILTIVAAFTGRHPSKRPPHLWRVCVRNRRIGT